MTDTVLERKLWFGFFLSINRTDKEWIHKDKVVRFGLHFERYHKPKTWLIGLVTGKVYSLFGHISQQGG